MNTFDQVKIILQETGLLPWFGLAIGVNVFLYVFRQFCPHCSKRWKKLYSSYYWCPHCGYNTINRLTTAEQIERMAVESIPTE